MSGIVAIIGVESAASDAHKIASTLCRTDVLSHVHTTTSAGSIGLVGVRSQVQRAPLATLQSGVTCVFQGYLSNRANLAKILRLPADSSDSFIVLNGFERMGESFFSKADGSFVFFLSDSATKTHYLVGDCYGHLHTFYYSDNEGHILIAPELKAFKACPWVKIGVDWKAIADYLVLGQPWGDKTFLEDVKSLEAGTFVRWDRSGRSTKQYWRIPYQKRIGREVSSAAFALELDRCLEACVTKLDSVKGKKGLFLSGGFDSRIIACYMQRVFGSSFDALGMQFNGQPATDSRASTRIAHALGIPWKPVNYQITEAEKLLAEHLEIHDGTWPCSYFPQALPVEQLRSEYDFVINGNNGNHIFGDYATTYFKFQMGVLNEGISADWFLQNRGDGLHRMVVFHILSQIKNSTLPMLAQDFAQQALLNAASSFDRQFFARMDISAADKFEYLAMTQTGRRWGLFNAPLQDHYEGLNPFYHDRSLLELMSSLPSELKFSRTWDSELLATQFPEVFMIPKISGYASFLRYQENLITQGVPVDDYYDGKSIFRNLLAPRIDTILNDPRFVSRQWINVPYVHSLWAQHKAGAADATAPLASIMALDYFLRTFTASE